jgi:hypothetical protein
VGLAGRVDRQQHEILPSASDEAWSCRRRSRSGRQRWKLLVSLQAGGWPLPAWRPRSRHGRRFGRSRTGALAPSMNSRGTAGSSPRPTRLSQRLDGRGVFGRGTRRRQQHGSRPIRLTVIARNRRCPQFRLLLLTRRHRKFASRVPVRESMRTPTQPAYLVAMT